MQKFNIGDYKIKKINVKSYSKVFHWKSVVKWTESVRKSVQNLKLRIKRYKSESTCQAVPSPQKMYKEKKVKISFLSSKNVA